MTYTDEMTREVNKVSSAQTPIFLLEIDHPDAPDLIRVAHNTIGSFTHLGNEYVGVAFRFSPLSQKQNEMPTATLQVDNVGRELTDWIVQTNGGRGAEVRFLIVLPTDPDTVQWEQTLYLKSVDISSRSVSADVGIEEMLSRPAFPATFNPTNDPALFTDSNFQ